MPLFSLPCALFIFFHRSALAQTRLALPLSLFLLLFVVLSARRRTHAHTRDVATALSPATTVKNFRFREIRLPSLFCTCDWLFPSLSLTHELRCCCCSSAEFSSVHRAAYFLRDFFGLIFSMLFLMMTLRGIHCWMIFPELPIGAGDDRRCGTVSSHGVHSLT